MRYVYRLKGLCCAACASKIEISVNKIEGVGSAKVVFMTQRMTLEADPSAIENIEPMIVKAIKKVEPDVTMRRE